MKRGDPLIHIEFITRDGDPSPYMGDYMFQYMTAEEVDVYTKILFTHFPTLFSSEELKKKKAKRVTA